MMAEPLPIRAGLTFRVAPEEVGERLDRFLARHLPDRSRSALARSIENGRVTIAGKVPGKAGHALRAGDEILVAELATPIETDALAEAIPLTIVYQDDHLVVIDKPSGLVVHPAPGHASGTLVNALLHWAKEENITLDVDDEARPGIVHRIDKDTSGLLVVALNDRVLRALQARFATHDIERRYRAVVLGPRIEESGTIRTPYGRDPKDRKRFTGRLAAFGRAREARWMRGASEASDEEYSTYSAGARERATKQTLAVASSRTLLETARREAITHWRVIQRGKALALIELTLETGRTHQIRVHLSEAGHAIVADPIYGHALPRNANGVFSTLANQELRAARVMPRLALHAAVLGFMHPVSGQWLRFESPDPPDFASLVAALR